MSFQQALCPELEAKAQELLARLRPQSESELLALARLLVSKGEQEIFGEREFQARDIVHRLGAQAVETFLAEKKTRTANLTGDMRFPCGLPHMSKRKPKLKRPQFVNLQLSLPS